MKPLFGINTIFSTEQVKKENEPNQTEQAQNLTATTTTPSQAEPQLIENQQNNDTLLVYEQKQAIRRIYLHNQDLPQDYTIRRQDPNLQVRGVMQIGDKCRAINAYGDMMILSLDDCKAYIGTGRVFRAINAVQADTNYPIADSPPPLSQDIAQPLSTAF